MISTPVSPRPSPPALRTDISDLTGVSSLPFLSHFLLLQRVNTSERYTSDRVSDHQAVVRPFFCCFLVLPPVGVRLLFCPAASVPNPSYPPRQSGWLAGWRASYFHCFPSIWMSFSVPFIRSPPLSLSTFDHSLFGRVLSFRKHPERLFGGRPTRGSLANGQYRLSSFPPLLFRPFFLFLFFR